MCFKVWEELTIPTFAKQACCGVRAGQPDPRFLDAKLFNDLVLTPYREAKFEPHTGPFLFEFQRHGVSSEEFCSRLDTFFSQLPRDFRYAVEIRNAGLLGSEYCKTLEVHGVAHVYNHWSYMPPLPELVHLSLRSGQIDTRGVHSEQGIDHVVFRTHKRRQGVRHFQRV